MPNTIEIDGIIGLDVWPSLISEKLREAKGEDVEILFSSPGGYIDDGIAIFNLIHDYEGKTTAKIIGVAASMASYIPLAADKVIAKSNAVYMIHDALGSLYGNEAEHAKMAKILGGFSNMLADIYVKKTGKTKNEIRALMREESYFFGSEMLDAGFVDEIDEVEVKGAEKDDVVLDAMAKVEMMTSKVREKPENYEKIAALLKDEDSTTPGRPAFSNIQTEERMDIAKLEAEFPDVYKAVYNRGKAEGEKASNETVKAEGKAAGILAERARIAGIEAFKMPDEFTAKAKSEDWSPEKAAAEYLKAEAAKKKDIAAGMEGEVSGPLASNIPDPAKEPDAGKPDLVAEYNAEIKKLTDAGVKRPEAIKAVVKNNPELHQAYLKGVNNG